MEVTGKYRLRPLPCSREEGVRIKQQSSGGDQERDVIGREGKNKRECRKKGSPGGEILNCDKERGDVWRGNKEWMWIWMVCVCGGADN